MRPEDRQLGPPSKASRALRRAVVGKEGGEIES